jgi:hypothetical protein
MFSAFNLRSRHPPNLFYVLFIFFYISQDIAILQGGGAHQTIDWHAVLYVLRQSMQTPFSNFKRVDGSHGSLVCPVETGALECVQLGGPMDVTHKALYAARDSQYTHTRGHVSISQPHLQS